MSEQFVRTPAGPDSIATLTTLLDDGAVTTRDARAAYSQAILALKALRDAKPAYWVHEVEGMDPMLWKDEPSTNVGHVRKLFYAPQEAAGAIDPDAGAKAFAESMGERWSEMGEDARARARELAAKDAPPQPTVINVVNVVPEPMATEASRSNMDLVGQLVVGWTSDGEDKFVAEARGYCDAPTFIFSREPYTTWRADMVRPATPEEAATYWRERALKAEGQEAHSRG